MRRLNSADDDDDVGNPADLAPLTRLILAKECVERGLITTPEQYIRAVEGPSGQPVEVTNVDPKTRTVTVRGVR